MITVRKLASIGIVLLAPTLAACTSSTSATSTTSTIPATSTTSTELPSVTAAQSAPRLDFLLAVDFASREDGAVAFDRGVNPDSGRCALKVAVTTDGGRTFRPSILLRRRTVCGSESPSLALAQGGTGWAAAAGHLWTISDDWRTWRVDSGLAAALGANAKKLAPCGVRLRGDTVWLSLCQSLQLGATPALLARSTDQGGTWVSSPVERSPGGFGVEPVGESGAGMALASPSNGALFGCVTECTVAGSSRSIVSTTDDAGDSWNDHNVCVESDGALVAASGSLVTVACVGELSGGIQAISIVASTDGGVKWQQMCANGAWATGTKRALCPSAGYPSSLVDTADGTLLMGLARQGVATSTDGGAIWRRSLSIPGGDSVDLASVGANAWAVSVSSLRLFTSVNGGRSWVGLPFRSKT